MTNEMIDVHEEVAGARVTPLHWWLGLMMGALTLFDGYDTFNPAYVIHYVLGPWGLKPGQAGLLVSSGLVGFLIGAAAHGIIADRVGRRVTLLGGLWLMSIFTLATPVFAHGLSSFCLLRLLTGLGLGVLMPLATTYINELTPRHVANTYTVWGVGFGWAIGGTLAGIVGVFLTPRYGWESLYYIGALSLLLIPILHRSLPESVKFLALKGRTEEICTLLSRLRPERAERYRHARFSAEAAPHTGLAVLTLLSARYRRTTLAIWSAAFFCLFCIFGLSGWVPTIMLQRGETFAASFGFGALMQIASFVGGLTCGYIADRYWSARPMMIVWWVLGAASVITLVFFNNHAINLVCATAAGFFVIGGQFVLNNFTAHSYETRVRATAVGMELSVGRFGAILGPVVAGFLQQAYPGSTAVFLAVAVGSLAAAAMIATAKSAPRRISADAPADAAFERAVS